MNAMPQPWDYLIVTASNDSQAQAYESQLAVRRQLGLLVDIGQTMVVADPGGKRIGSGGSTVFCLIQVLNWELERRGGDPADWTLLQSILSSLRILIIHAGGDSRRVPVYGPCGKIFVPVPGQSDGALGSTLFDRQLPTFAALPAGPVGAGQVVVTAGDALIRFNPADVRFADEGLTALGCFATAEAASKHGVFCPGPNGRVRLYLQKPKPAEQQTSGALNRHGQSVLDIGVMSFDAATAISFLKTFEAVADSQGRLAWSESMNSLMLTRGLDIYREVCCAMGDEATAGHHLAQARGAGCSWDQGLLAGVFESLHAIPFSVQVVPRCSFLHFGTTRQLITSGLELMQQDTGAMPAGGLLVINNQIVGDGRIGGTNCWVEACRVGAPLTLGGNNVLVGVDVDGPLAMGSGACLDVVYGRTRDGQMRHIIRPHGITDTFKDTVEAGGTFCNIPLATWMAAAGIKAEDIWDSTIAPGKRSLWDAKVFPAETKAAGYRDWLWMFNPAEATAAQKKAFLAADRYSAAEIAVLAELESFYSRRSRIRAHDIRHSLRQLFRPESRFSAQELGYALANTDERAACVAELLAEAHWHLGAAADAALETFAVSRILHSLGGALRGLDQSGGRLLGDILPGLATQVAPAVGDWLEKVGLSVCAPVAVSEWAAKAEAAAFAHVNSAIGCAGAAQPTRVRSVLREGEMIVGRAPARIELGGGWTDVPPYSMEAGGGVVNVAVNLNGQAPIQCYCRVIDRPVIRLCSIDAGEHVEISGFEQLGASSDRHDTFAMHKAAISLLLFPGKGGTLEARLKEFGGGIDLTTVLALPAGGGLGAKTILGAVVVSVIHRLVGRSLTPMELGCEVTRLEQVMGSGAGWQDWVGGVLAGVKLTTTETGVCQEPRTRYLPGDLLCPRMNGGTTLLYYTGVTCGNPLWRVVGGYLNRHRATLATLGQERLVAGCLADALSAKDAVEVGQYLDIAGRLAKQLCPDLVNDQIETLLARVRPFVLGARVLDAGGFVLMLCKTAGDAEQVRRALTADPVTPGGRFYEYEISLAGLEIVAC